MSDARADASVSDPELQLARVLLVQACEESDPEGRFLPRREREAAGREARQAAGDAPPDPRRFFVERADRLAEGLVRRHPALRSALALARLRIPGGLVLAATLLAGFTADALGSERRINLLAFPLLALLLWNLAVYGLQGLAPLLLRRTRTSAAAALPARAAAWLARRRIAGGSPDEARWQGAALQRFALLWGRATAALWTARVRRLLHLGALGFAAGIVAGMYVRGLAFEYRASWESTFLDAPHAARLLGTVLGPAATLLDALRPAADPSAAALLREPAIAALRAPGEGPAATWIHLWALTAAAAIGVPRALLAWREGRRARRLAAGLAPDLGDPYFLRLGAPDRGAGVNVEVLAYSHRLAPAAQDALLELLHELFGNRARIELRDPLPYGTEAPPPPPATGAAHARVVVFNLAQPPEEEVHGAFLRALLLAREGAAPPPALLLLLDEEPYRARLGEGGAAEERLGQRRRAWERVARAADLRFATLRPLGAEADAVLRDARDALERPIAGVAA
ncbi:MAG TPA: hypothetical protein VIN04_06910 [Myxococcota bacterium]